MSATFHPTILGDISRQEQSNKRRVLIFGAILIVFGGAVAYSVIRSSQVAKQAPPAAAETAPISVPPPVIDTAPAPEAAAGTSEKSAVTPAPQAAPEAAPEESAPPAAKTRPAHSARKPARRSSDESVGVPKENAPSALPTVPVPSKIPEPMTAPAPESSAPATTSTPPPQTSTQSSENPPPPSR
jgi:hypothetical protein